MPRLLILALSAGALLTNTCAAHATQKPALGFSLELIESRRIWDRASFNGFTDLIRFKGNWYLALREATDHGGTWDGNIRILRSADGRDWTSASQILCPKGSQTDLRDPKLCITPQGQLMLTSTAYWPRETLQSYTWFSDDGVSWSPPPKVGPPSEWLWRTEWHKGVAYNFGANRLGTNSLQLYTSADGREFKPHGPRQLLNMEASETGIVFAPDDTCYALLRQAPTAMIGFAKPPYTEFTWKHVGMRVGGPEMILLPNGELLAAGRLYDDGEYTALVSIEPDSGTLTKLLKLPSGGDTSYPGMVLDENNVLWVSYYSSHQGKTSVYLAQVKVTFDDSPKRPIQIGTQKQLFLDDYILAKTESVFPVLNQPVKHPGNPVIRLEPRQTVGGDELTIIFGNVIYDDEHKLFKMWYEASNYGGSNRVTAYTSSKDGIEWDLPCLRLFPYPKWHLKNCGEDDRDNNIILDPGFGEVAPAVIKDVHEEDPAKRYKMLYFSRGNGSPIAPAWSADGIRWGEPPPGNWIPDNDSSSPFLWDPKLGKYVTHKRYNADTPNGLERQVMQYESDDFVNWTKHGVIMKADDKDPLGHRQFYEMPWMEYEGVYIGFLSVYHLMPEQDKNPPGHSWEDKTDIQLTFSRDNRRWMRAGNRQTFLPNSQTPGAYDYATIYVMHRPIVVGDEIWIYYHGNSGLHWGESRAELMEGTACLAKLRLDGFVSLDAGGQGTVITKPFTFTGTQLVLNASTRRGSVAVEVLGEDGKPIRGFTRKDADGFKGDSVRHQATWNGRSDVSPLIGKTVALRFYLNRSKLYSFAFGSGG